MAAKIFYYVLFYNLACQHHRTIILYILVNFVVLSIKKLVTGLFQLPLQLIY